ncbi:MAG: hypothetical protein JWN21_877 [Sphingomonas bacterium]|nr:hypothetical protein [Sphingomonas bacterium]
MSAGFPVNAKHGSSRALFRAHDEVASAEDDANGMRRTTVSLQQQIDARIQELARPKPTPPAAAADGRAGR